MVNTRAKEAVAICSGISSSQSEEEEANIDHRDTQTENPRFHTPVHFALHFCLPPNVENRSPFPSGTNGNLLC
jgi:hypothetical protein